ncbi:MAG: hypothetical protein H0T75_12845 [Rhizobiales bacterium]|nr:hypothetical protein [Hyphomicrobiales bacterium]
MLAGHSSEQDRPDVDKARAEWIGKRQPKMRLKAHRLVFVDETGTTTKMTRRYSRCPKGQRLKAKGPFGLWKTQTFIAGLREELADAHGLEKIKTAGDAFMAAAGLILPNPDPVLASVRCGLAMAEAARRSRAEWQLRTGIHLGPVIAGVVGRQKFAYDLWGDTINVAARLSSLGAEGRITSPETLGCKSGPGAMCDRLARCQ